jgi:hemerythrin
MEFMKIKKFKEYQLLNGIEVIKKLKLEDHLGNLLNDNKSNNAPYHNLNHTLCVIKNVYYLANQEDLNNKEIKNLVLAAIYHDFNHSQGEKKDDENIKEAIKALKKYVEGDTTDIEELIKATQYPYVIEDKDLSDSQKVLKDADVMQIFEDNFIQQVIYGLSTELKMSVKDFLPIQIKFLDNLKYYTKAAQEISKSRLSTIKDETNFLIDLLNKKSE